MPFLHDRGHFFIKFIFLILICGPALVTCAEFVYENQTSWPEDFKLCGGKRQSPISLSRSKNTELRKFPRLTFNNFTKKMDAPLTLFLSSLSVNLDTVDTSISIEGGPLRNKYIFNSLHFHWGAFDSRGSEHMLDGRRASLELHAIFINEKYPTKAEAVIKKDGLAVVGILLRAGSTYKVPVQVNGLDIIMDNLKNVRPEDSFTLRQSLSLSDIFGKVNRNKYYTYSGSLTTPTCNEAVTWIVLSEIVPVSRTKIKNFRQVRDENNKRIVDNFRFIQPIGNRKIFLNV